MLRGFFFYYNKECYKKLKEKYVFKKRGVINFIK